METSAKLLVALNLLGVAQALLLAAALLSVKRGNRIANRFLAAFVIVIAIGVGGATMASDRFIIQYPHLLKIQDPFYLLGAPLLFLYVRTLIKGRVGIRKERPFTLPPVRPVSSLFASFLFPKWRSQTCFCRIVF